VVTLSLLSVERIDVYVALFAIEFFVASELTSPFGLSESRRRIVMGILLLAIFTGIVLQRIVEILG
jgi:ABC-type thiamin/hydroxymethylpyrimidine transport system permease subunit